MTRRANGRRTLLVLVVLSAACGASPTSATSSKPAARPTPTPAATPAPAPGTGFPTASGSPRVFVAVHSMPRASRFLLYDDCTFVLQYSGGPDYRGTYTELDGVLTFAWEGWSMAGPWGATGTITDDSLVVKFNILMMLSDFVDDVYMRSQ
jgi:hypothetical protein